MPNMASSTRIKKNKSPLKAGATGKSSNPNTVRRAKALQGISGAEAELVRARSNLRTQICQQKKKAKQTDEYAQLPDDRKESWLADYAAAKTKRAVARVADAERDAEAERAHLKTIQEEEKAAAQMTMTLEKLMADLGEKVDGVCGSVGDTRSDDGATSNGRARSLEDDSNAGDDRDGEEHAKLSKPAAFPKEHFLWLYRLIEQVSRREAERYLNERDARAEAAKGSVTGTSAAETGQATKTAEKRQLSSGTAAPRKRRASGKAGGEAEGRPTPGEGKKTNVW